MNIRFAAGLFYGLCLTLPGLSLQAVILLSGDQSVNLDAPDEARRDVFNSVAKVSNLGGSSPQGSAVHLRGKYLLTAAHVQLGSDVTFDGTTYFERDTAFTPINFAPIDMKLFKLLEDPGLPGTELFSSSSGDTPVTTRFFLNRTTTYTTGTLIGWGLGRKPEDPDGSTVWNWGPVTADMPKRWGENRIEGATTHDYTHQSIDYIYEALTTKLDNNGEVNEAAATLYDSGSGLFIEESGVWKLAGLTTSVSTNGSSTFGGPNADLNFFVRINQYAELIEAALPDLSKYEDWVIDHSLFGPEADPLADPDGDGIINLLEFTLAGNPRRADTSVLPVLGIDLREDGERYLSITYTRPAEISGINYLVQTTEYLDSWSGGSTGIDPDPQILQNPDGTQTWTHFRTVPLSESEKAFLRLKINLLP